MNWYGMEQIVSNWLKENQINFIENHSTGGLVEFDFIIPDLIPTIVEVKYAHFQNRALVELLFLHSCYVFHRFRLVLIVVGEKSNIFDGIQDIVSKIVVFNPANFEDSEIEVAAQSLLSKELLPFEKLRALSLDDTNVRAASHELQAQHHLKLDWEAISSLQDFFGNELQPIIRLITESIDSSTLPKSMANLISNELMQLLCEYESEHYTAGALRLGRCFEYVVYSFAQLWKLNLYRSDFELIAKLKNEMDTLNSLLTQVSDSDGKANHQLKQNIKNKVHKVQGLLNDILTELDYIGTSPIGPSELKNVDSILRQASKQFARVERARELLRSIIEENISRQILEMRNKAAHGDPELYPREVTREELQKMLLNLSDVVHRLLNAFSILS